MKEKKEKKTLLKPKSLKEKDTEKLNTKSGEKTVSENGKKKNKKLGWKIFKICIFTFLALCIIGAGIVFGVISGIIDKTDSLSVEDLKVFKQTSFVYDKDGKEIGAFFDTESRLAVPYSEIPKSVVDAVTSIEDERFFKHNGIDIKRTLGAIFSYVVNRGDSDFGGSTITQQLVKNVKQDKDKSWQRKIREWYRAISIETKLSKEDIMESYLTTVYLGDGKYGVELASQNYFAKSVKDVNIAESAILAALIQTPGSTNPYGGEESKEKLLSRQKLVLSQMLKLGKITKEEYDEAINYEIAFKKGNTAISDEVQTYFVDAVYEQIIKDLMEQKGIDEGVAQKMLYTDGLKIYSTQDSNVQKVIDEEYANKSLFYEDSKGFMQSAMVVMDQSTGNVVGLIGGADEKTGARVKNRATSSIFKRQPGSTMKPIGAYGPAFEQGLLAPGMGLDDSPLVLGSYNPGNYYGYFNGYVTAREAINKSMNLPALRACQRATVDYAYTFAKNCGLTSLVESDKSIAALALGGVTNGFTVLEMCNAYATIANGGVHIDPKLYTKVEDKDGNILLENKTVAKKVMDPATAYLLTSSLQSVITNGTGAGVIKIGNMPVTGKTGNTNDDKDQWFVGYTPYYTVACWNGYDEPKAIGRRKAVGTYPYTCMAVWNNVVKRITQGQAYKNFEKPGNVVTASVCRDSGMVATDACRSDQRGDRTNTDLFISGKVPTETCTIHKTAKICSETGLLANEFCPNVAEKSFITRDFEPRIKPRDWIYMLPTSTCTVHTKKPEVPEEKPDDGKDDEVDIYGNKPKN